MQLNGTIDPSTSLALFVAEFSIIAVEEKLARRVGGYLVSHGAISF